MKSELSHKGKWQEQTFENRKWRKLRKKMLSPHPLFLQLLLRTKESFQPAVPSCCSSWQPEILMRPEWLLHIPYPAKQTLAAHPISEATVIWHWHEFSLRVWPQPSMINSIPCVYAWGSGTDNHTSLNALVPHGHTGANKTEFRAKRNC